MEAIINSIKSLDFFSKVVYGNTIFDYTIFILLFLIIFFLLNPLIKILLKIFGKLAEKTATDLDDKLIAYFAKRHNRSLFSLELSIAFYAAIHLITLSSQVQKIIDNLAIILITIFLVSTLIDIIRYIIKNKYAANDPRASSLLLIFPVIKIFI
jgi:hypothetical protein